MAAWSHIYRYGLSTTPTSVLGYAIVAVKNELRFNGFGNGLTAEPLFGNYARDNTVAFQKKFKLEADGEVGPLTARALFRKRASELEKKYGLPANLLNQQKTLESGNDPAATGVVDPDDTGLMQIHLPFFPSVTVADAVDPAFAMDWAAKKLVSDHASCGGDWDGALAAYNIGTYYASHWVKDGKPASGKVVGDKDLYTTATQYVKAVHAMPV